MIGEVLTVMLRNHHGEDEFRTIRPIGLRYGTNLHYPDQPQWLLDAFDLVKNAERSFPLRDLTPTDGAQRSSS